MYEDEFCTVLVHQVPRDGEDRLVVHARVIPTTKRELLDHYYDVMEGFFEGVKAKGITEVETWVREGIEMDFAQLYGFDQFIGEFQIEGEGFYPPIFVLKKEL